MVSDDEFRRSPGLHEPSPGNVAVTYTARCAFCPARTRWTWVRHGRLPIGYCLRKDGWRKALAGWLCPSCEALYRRRRARR